MLRGYLCPEFEINASYNFKVLDKLLSISE
jgi:hypothetical protein